MEKIDTVLSSQSMILDKLNKLEKALDAIGRKLYGNEWNARKLTGTGGKEMKL